jgi:hypothetical protein
VRFEVMIVPFVSELLPLQFSEAAPMCCFGPWEATVAGSSRSQAIADAGFCKV